MVHRSGGSTAGCRSGEQTRVQCTEAERGSRIWRKAGSMQRVVKKWDRRKKSLLRGWEEVLSNKDETKA